jgi:hypothetical protein
MNEQQTVILGATNEDLSECVWWASGNDGNENQTLFLSRKESGQELLLDKFFVSPETVPTL